MAKAKATEGQLRRRLSAMQTAARELTACERQLWEKQQEIRDIKKRIKLLQAKLQLESLEADNAITAGESAGDVVGKIGGRR